MIYKGWQGYWHICVPNQQWLLSTSNTLGQFYSLGKPKTKYVKFKSQLGNFQNARKL